MPTKEHVSNVLEERDDSIRKSFVGQFFLLEYSGMLVQHCIAEIGKLCPSKLQGGHNILGFS